MKVIEKWISKLNQSQKIISAIVIPLGLFLLFYRIADNFDDNLHYAKPFRLQSTWGVWLIYVAIVGFVEVKLFEQKKEE